MGKQSLLTLLLGVSIGANAVLVAWMATGPEDATGQTVHGAGEIVLATGQISGKGNADALYIYNAAERKLLVYIQNNNSLELLAVRDLSYDWSPRSFSPKGGRQRPTVEEMKKGVSKP